MIRYLEADITVGGTTVHYCGGCSVLWRIFSTVEDINYCERCSKLWGLSHSTVGNNHYLLWWIQSVLCRSLSSFGDTSNVLLMVPPPPLTVSSDSTEGILPHSTEHHVQYCTDVPQGVYKTHLIKV